MVYEARKQSVSWMEHGLLKRYALSMKDKMAARAFGRARNYGWDSPLTCQFVFLLLCRRFISSNYVLSALIGQHWQLVRWLAEGIRAVSFQCRAQSRFRFVRFSLTYLFSCVWSNFSRAAVPWQRSIVKSSKNMICFLSLANCDDELVVRHLFTVGEVAQVGFVITWLLLCLHIGHAPITWYTIHISRVQYMLKHQELTTSVIIKLC